MNHNSWQHPFVNIFKHFDIDSAKKSTKSGDVTSFIDRDLKCIIYRIRGLVPADNYIHFPAQNTGQSLGLVGRLFYILFRPLFNKTFTIDVDILTQQGFVIHLSISNNYREFRITQTNIQFPYMTTGTDIHWSVLCLDLHMILLTYITNAHYHSIKSFQLSGNMNVKNCFTSSHLYEPGIDNDTAKRTGLSRAGIHSFPRELSFPSDKSESWHSKYDFIMFPNGSVSTAKNPNEPFDKVGNVRLPALRRLGTNEEERRVLEQEYQIPVTVQTAVVEGHSDRSMSNFAFVTQRSKSKSDNELHWRTYSNLTTKFNALPVVEDTFSNDRDSVHVFVNKKSSENVSKNEDDSQSRKFGEFSKANPIVELRSTIGLTTKSDRFYWTSDDNFIVYPSDGVIVQIHIKTRQQWFFVGHNDRISDLTFNENSNLLASVQTGNESNLRIWSFENRRCLLSVRVPNVFDLRSVEFGPRFSSSFLLVAGRNEQCSNVVLVYSCSNLKKSSSIELIGRASLPFSVVAFRFISSKSADFISFGRENLHFWTLQNGKELRSREESFGQENFSDLIDVQIEENFDSKQKQISILLPTKRAEIFQIFLDEQFFLERFDLSSKLKSQILSFASTNKFRITGSSDGFLRLWSRDFSSIFIEANYNEAINFLSISHDQTRLFVSTSSVRLSLLNLIEKVHHDLIENHGNSINDVQIDFDNQRILTAANDGKIRLWDYSTLRLLKEFQFEREIPLRLAFTHDRRQFSCGFNNGVIQLFDVSSWKIVAEIRHHSASINGLYYSYKNSYLVSSDREGNLCLSDVTNFYQLQRFISEAIVPNDGDFDSVSLSSDGKYLAYVGPAASTVTILEINSLTQIQKLDVSQASFVESNGEIVSSKSDPIFARFVSDRQIIVATSEFKLIKYDFLNGKILTIIDRIHKNSLESLCLSFDQRYLVTGGDRAVKFVDLDLNSFINFQNFAAHSGSIRKVLFTDDGMTLISVGDSICFWDVLNRSKTESSMPNDGECLFQPDLLFDKIAENSKKISSSSLDFRPVERSNCSSPVQTEIQVFQPEKKEILENLLTKQTKPTVQCHFLPSIRQSELGKKRFLAPVNGEILELNSVFGYNGNARDNLIWYPSSGLFLYSLGCNIIIENLHTHQQSFLLGHTEEISTLAISKNGLTLASAQISTRIEIDKFQSKIIIWNIENRRQKRSFIEKVEAVQAMEFSRNERYLLIVGNYRKATLILRSTDDFREIFRWENALTVIHCVSWNSRQSNEFCFGGSRGSLYFCSICPEAEKFDVRSSKISSLFDGENDPVGDVTSCVYLTTILNSVLCATSHGYVTCWNSRLALCLFHWRADFDEICFLRTNHDFLLTGSSTGVVKLWKIDKFRRNFEEKKVSDRSEDFELEEKFELDGAIVSGSFDDQFELGLVGTSAGTIWFLNRNVQQSKSRLVTSDSRAINNLLLIDDSTFCTSDDEGTIRIFSIDDHSEISRIQIDGSKINCLAFWARRKGLFDYFVVGGREGTLRLLNRSNGEISSKWSAHKSSVDSIHIPWKSDFCLSASSDGSLAISNLAESFVVRSFVDQSEIVSIDSFRSTNDSIYRWATSRSNQQINLWESNEFFDQTKPFDCSIKSSTIDQQNSSGPTIVRFPDFSTLIILIDRQLKIFQIEQKNFLRQIPIGSICFSFDFLDQRNFVAIARDDRILQIRHLTQENFQDFIGHSDRISSLKFHRSKQILISVSDKEIFLWRLKIN